MKRFLIYSSILFFLLEISVYAQFNQGTDLGVGVDNGSMKLGDIDNDGDLDLVVAGRQDQGNKRLDKYINDGSGHFSAPIPFGIPVGWERVSIELGDIDNDGDLDLIVSGDGRLDLYKNNGTGDFGNAIPFGIGVQLSSIALGDTDNDGRLDLIVSGYGKASGESRYRAFLCYYYNVDIGIGNYGALCGGVLGIYNGSIALGDINNDGSLDVISAGYHYSTLTSSSLHGSRLDKYTNKGDGYFNGYAQIGGWGVKNASIVLGDIDNDSDLDIIVTGGSKDLKLLAKYFNNGTGNFEYTYAYASTYRPANFGPGVTEGSVVLGDIDNDNDNDLVVSGSGRLDFYLNDGTGNFGSPNSFGAGLHRTTSVLGDVDNDGDLDFIIAGDYSSDRYSNNPRSIRLYLNSTYTGPAVTVTAPTAPDTLSISKIKIVLTWTDNSNTEDHYIIYQNTSNNFSGAIVVTILPPNSTTFTIDNLPFNADYYFWVQATNTAGESVSPLISIHKTIPAASTTSTTTDSSPTEPVKTDENLVHTAIVQAELGNYILAQKILQNELIKDPSDCYLLNNLANVFYLQKNYKMAVEYYKKALTLCSEPRLIINCIFAYYKAGVFKEALSLYLKVFSADRESTSEKEILILIEQQSRIYKPYWLDKQIIEKELKEIYR
jgi:hypothetical protein